MKPDMIHLVGLLLNRGNRQGGRVLRHILVTLYMVLNSF